MAKNYNEKTIFNIIQNEDIKEIKEVMDYARGLIIKVQEIADKYETITSMRIATTYVSAYYELTDTDYMNRQVIINSYTESNEYYKFLHDNYGIEYAEARIAPDLKILKAMNLTLSSKDEALFNTCYNETLEYYKKTFFTKAFMNQQFNKEYFITMLISMTIQKYITRKLEFYFDIDKYNLKELKNSFISYGYDYFDSLPINYQRRVLKVLNELIISKGTNNVIRKILDIFGNSDIEIYKYIMAKLYDTNSEGEYDYQNPYLIFYKTKADSIIDYENDLVLDYEQMTSNDPFWKVDKDEVLYHRIFNTDTEEYENKSNRMFNAITTKYMSIDFQVDVLHKSYQLSNIYNMLYKIENEYKDKINQEKFSFYDSNISSSRISIFTGIMGLTSLMLRSQGLTDNIRYFLDVDKTTLFNRKGMSDNNIDLDSIKERLKEIEASIPDRPDDNEKFNEENSNCPYGFEIRDKETFRLYNKIKTDGINTAYGVDCIENNNDIQQFLDELLSVIQQNKESLEFQRTYNELYKFFRTFHMANFNTPLDENDMSILYQIYNNSGEIPYQLKNGLIPYTSDVSLLNYLQDDNNDIINRLNYLRIRLIRGNVFAYGIFKYKELTSLFQKYIYYEGYRNPRTRLEENSTIILYNENFRKSCVEWINNNDDEVCKDFFDLSDTVGLFKHLYDYTLKHRQEIISKYKLDTQGKLENYLRYDTKDVSYYPELYATMNILYAPFIENENLYKDKKYDLDGFMNVVNHNEKLREQLEKYIIETDNYHMYRLYNAIYYAKFIKIKNSYGNKIFIDELLDKECFEIVKRLFKKIYPNTNVEELEIKDLINFTFDMMNNNYMISDKKSYFLGIIDEIMDYEKDVLFSDYVKRIDLEFYNWLFEEDEGLVEKTDKEKQQYYVNKIFELSECLDTALNVNVFSNFPFAGLLDETIKILYILCNIFKAYTVDMVQADSILRMNSPTDEAFNTIRLFDEVLDFKIIDDGDNMKDTLRLIDIFIEFLKEEKEDTLDIKDEFNIEIIDEE